jgi:hypothetical protein
MKEWVMNTKAILALIVSLPLASAAFADAASGMASGKRQHKPMSAEQPGDETEAQGTRVRKTMQEPKNNAEEVAAGKKKDDDVAAKTDKSEAARARKKH